MTEPYVRPDVRIFLDQMAAGGARRAVDVSLAEARNMLHASRHLFDLPTGELAVIRDVEGGPCPMRLYDPRAERETFAFVAIVYWICAFSMSSASRNLERKLGVGKY